MSSQRVKIAGIILAAGLSRRMGRVKSLLPLGRGVLLDWVIENAHQSALASVIVVLGHDAEKIRQRVRFLDSEIIFNPDYQLGQSASLRAGLAAVSDDIDGAMFLLGDQPLVGEKVIDTLIRAFEARPSSLVIPTYRGNRGNPVLVHRSIFRKIESLTGDSGARVLFDSLKDQILEVDVQDPRIHLDVDTIVDYRELKTLVKVPSF